MLMLIFLLNTIFSTTWLDNTSTSKFDKINLNSKRYHFKLLGDLEGTSMILKVKDAKHETIAVFKPSSGSTNHRGEYAAYKLGQILGLTIYPKVKIAKIPYTRLIEIKEILNKIEFKKFYGKKHILHMKAKEKNRKKMLAHLDNLIKHKKGLEGALKIWVKKLIFSSMLGSMQSFLKNPVYFNLVTGKEIKKKYLSFSQYTNIFKPKGTYYWYSDFKKLTKDFSSMLLVDAVLGNRDRFPGGNVHFTPVNIDKVRHKGKKINFNESNLISIDNGAVLQNKNEALVLLKKIRIKHFDKMILKKLKDFFKQKPSFIKKSLKLTTKETKLVIRNFNLLNKWLNSFK